MTYVLYKETEEEETQTQRRCEDPWEDGGRSWNYASGNQGTNTWRREERRNSPLKPPEGNNPSNILISDF